MISFSIGVISMFHVNFQGFDEGKMNPIAAEK